MGRLTTIKSRKVQNYRTPGLTRDCLESVAALALAATGLRVTVVDNNSGDGSAIQLRDFLVARGWADWASVLELPSNGGFAAGNNAAIRADLDGELPADYYWLLNPDTIVRPGALEELVHFLESNPKAGMAGSRLEERDGTPQRSAFRFPGAISEFERAMRFGPVSRLAARFLVAPPIRHDIHRTDWLSGASLLVRREVFLSTGLLDDRFFLYYEELDFCRRAYDLGWECWYVPTSRVVHLVGQSTGIAVTARRVPRYWFESRKRYFDKHQGRVRARLTDAAWAIGFALWRVHRLVQRKPDDDPPRLLGDFIRCSFLTRGTPRLATGTWQKATHHRTAHA